MAPNPDCKIRIVIVSGLAWLRWQVSAEAEACTVIVIALSVDAGLLQTTEVVRALRVEVVCRTCTIFVEEVFEGLLAHVVRANISATEELLCAPILLTQKVRVAMSLLFHANAEACESCGAEGGQNRILALDLGCQRRVQRLTIRPVGGIVIQDGTASFDLHDQVAANGTASPSAPAPSARDTCFDGSQSGPC